MQRIAKETAWGQLLAWLVRQGGSDLHGQAGKPICYRLNGVLERVPDAVCATPSEAQFAAWVEEAFGETDAARIHAARELDLSANFETVRFRINASKQQGLQSISFRVVPRHTLMLADLQLPV